MPVAMSSCLPMSSWARAKLQITWPFLFCTKRIKLSIIRDHTGPQQAQAVFGHFAFFGNGPRSISEPVSVLLFMWPSNPALISDFSDFSWRHARDFTILQADPTCNVCGAVAHKLNTSCFQRGLGPGSRVLLRRLIQTLHKTGEELIWASRRDDFCLSATSGSGVATKGTLSIAFVCC